MNDGRFADKYFLTDEEAMLRESVREFCEQELRPRIPELDKHGAEFPHDLYKKAAELGYTGLTAPEDIGGSNMSTICQMILIEELGRVEPGFAAVIHSTSGLGLVSFLIAGTDEQKDRFAKKVMTGESYCSFALTEPQSGSDAGGTQTSARFDEETQEWVLNGQKAWITGIESGGFFVVCARTDPESHGGHGLSMFAVESGTPGLTIGEPEKKLGARCSSSGSIFFDDCRIPKDNLIGNEGDGFKIMMQGLDMGRLGIAAMSIGIAQCCYEQSVEYATHREAFGTTISNFQGISFPIAEMGAKIDACRSMLYNAARMKDAGQPYSAEAASVKLLASELCVACAEEAVQIHGGVGYSEDTEVTRMWRESKLQTIGEGTSEIQHIVISRAAFRGEY
ncbi:MAG: acyl-CoA dehydrogenase family protein [Eggerthellaceae bacterium]|jgi:butyryl-CoA dehydrogenase